jgi:hypothetical protein
MSIKAITKSDTVTLAVQCSKQPSWIYASIGGDLVLHTRIGDDITVTVADGSWFPCDSVTLVKAATTAQGLVGWISAP